MTPKDRLGALAGLRLVAAVVVAVAHLPELSHDSRTGVIAARFLSEGLYGLTIFFVLSGFVLAYGYHERLARPSGSEMRRYYAARLARIWPLHLFTLGLVLLIPTSPQPGGVGPLVANVFMVHGWVPDLKYIQSYNSVSWTLSVEAFFYLVFPLFVYAAGRWTTVKPNQLYLAAVGVWLIISAVVLSLSRADPGLWPLYFANVCPPVRCGEFLVGVLLGLAFVRRGVSPGPATVHQRWWTLAELMAIVAVGLLIYRSHRVPLLYRMNGYYLPAVAAAVTLFAQERGMVSRVMASRAVVYLSEITFAFYLLHFITFTHLGAAMPLWLGPWPKAVVLFLTTGLMAAVLHRLVELPARERIIRWLRGSPKTSTPPLHAPTRIAA